MKTLDQHSLMMLLLQMEHTICHLKQGGQQSLNTPVPGLNVALDMALHGIATLDKDTFLIWTHGSVQHDELAGKNLNYYKNGRGIHAPLLVKRFMGKSSALELFNEILILTKMNWNSGDGSYKILPVTLDFAKALSRVDKQDLVVYDRPYNFRYFM